MRCGGLVQLDGLFVLEWYSEGKGYLISWRLTGSEIYFIQVGVCDTRGDTLSSDWSQDGLIKVLVVVPLLVILGLWQSTVEYMLENIEDLPEVC